MDMSFGNMSTTSLPGWIALQHHCGHQFILFLILGIPLSWHKAALSMEVDWIGWRISFSSWSISVPETKISKICAQVSLLMANTKVPIKELQSLVGRLLWLTSAWHYLRPLLIPLYKALGRLPVTMIGMDHVVFQRLVSDLSSDMVLQVDLTKHHHSVAKDITVVRVANTHVKTI